MNSIVLIGSVGKDIEYLGTESKIGKFSICVNETKLNKDSGEWEKISSNWFECVLSGKILQQHQTKITKGNLIGVIGKLVIKKHNEKYYTNINVYNVITKDKIGQFNKDYFSLLANYKSENNNNSNNVTGYEEPPKRHRYADDEVPF
jgi:single-stranded DNA-binding protein